MEYPTHLWPPMGDDGVLVHMPSKEVYTECGTSMTAAQCERRKKTGCQFDVAEGAGCSSMNSRDPSEIVGNWCDEDGQCLLTPDDIAAMARFNQTPLATRLAKITTGPPLDIAPRATAITLNGGHYTRSGLVWVPEEPQPHISRRKAGFQAAPDIAAASIWRCRPPWIAKIEILSSRPSSICPSRMDTRCKSST